MRLMMIALWSVCAWASLCSAATFKWMFHGHIKGADYTFNVVMGERDRWDSSSQEQPPLAPGKAVRLARQFMQKIAPEGSEPVHFAMPGDTSPRSGYVHWTVSQVRLLPYVDEAGHELWVYAVSFHAIISGTGRSGPPDIEVPIRMDGTIPEPVVSKGNPNPQGGANGRQPAGSGTNQTSSAAASRRCPTRSA